MNGKKSKKLKKGKLEVEETQEGETFTENQIYDFTNDIDNIEDDKNDDDDVVFIPNHKFSNRASPSISS